MAYYQRISFDKNNKKNCFTIEKQPSDIGRWAKNKELDAPFGIKTTNFIVDTKSKLNKKVVKSISYFADGSRMVSILISNSSRMPKKYKK